MRRVYFIKPVGTDGPIKIGCSANPKQRLGALSRKHSPLEIAATVPGGFFTERQFHTVFREDHIGHEWFASSRRLLSVIEQINAGHFDMAKLPTRPMRLPRKVIEYTPVVRAEMAEAARRNSLWLKVYHEQKAIADAAGVAVSRWALNNQLAQAAAA